MRKGQIIFLLFSIAILLFGLNLILGPVTIPLSTLFNLIKGGVWMICHTILSSRSGFHRLSQPSLREQDWLLQDF